MDFKFCLLAPCSESPSLAMQKFRDDVTAHAHFGAIFSNRNEQEGHHGALGNPLFKIAISPQILHILRRPFGY